MPTAPFKPRPLPEQLLLVAFPDARQQGVTPAVAAAFAASDADAFFLVQAAADSIQLSLPDKPDWLQLSSPLALAPELSRINCQALDNIGAARGTEVVVQIKSDTWRLRVLQGAGALVQTQMLGTLNAPLTIDLLVAVTFMAQQIKKIPVPPIKLLVTVIAVLALVALGFAASVLRHGFINVPEPRPLSTNTGGVPITVFPGFQLNHGLPLAAIAAEDQTIALQTVREIYWLIKQVL